MIIKAHWSFREMWGASIDCTTKSRILAWTLATGFFPHSRSMDETKSTTRLPLIILSLPSFQVFLYSPVPSVDAEHLRQLINAWWSALLLYLWMILINFFHIPFSCNYIVYNVYCSSQPHTYTCMHVWPIMSMGSVIRPHGTEKN